MTVAIKCKSLLLEKTLSIFLKDYLGDSSHCDVLISDKFIQSRNNLFVISNRDDANLSLPFSKQKLLDSLKSYMQKNHILKQTSTKDINIAKKPQALEDEIQSIMYEYTQKIVFAIKKYQN